MLSPSGRTVVRLLDGVEPHEAATLYSTLPSGFREELARISPSTHVGDLRARLLVMHGPLRSGCAGRRVPPPGEGDGRSDRCAIHRVLGLRSRASRPRWHIHTSGTGRPPLPPHVRRHPHSLLDLPLPVAEEPPGSNLASISTEHHNTTSETTEADVLRLARVLLEN